MSLDLGALQARWAGTWEQALSLWSSYTRLSPPHWCWTEADEKREGLQTSFAAIRLRDLSVLVSLRQVAELGLDDYALEILAHEIGHHVYAPGNLTDDGRALARMRRALPTLEAKAPLVCNIYQDLLINDRLHRTHGLRFAEIYRAIEQHTAPPSSLVRTVLQSLARTVGGTDPTPPPAPRGKRLATIAQDAAAEGVLQGALAITPGEEPAQPSASTQPGTEGRAPQPGLFDLMMRIYEILWSLRRGTLAPEQSSGTFEGDAQLGARLCRSYARDWVSGSGRFAALCFPYLLDERDAQAQRVMLRLSDLGQNDPSELPDGLTAIELDEILGNLHPSLDPRLNSDLSDEATRDSGDVEGTSSSHQPTQDAEKGPPQGMALPSRGQFREPFEYGQLLKSMGINLSDHDIACAYYKERARPHLVQFPRLVTPETEEPLAEGMEAWDIGSPLESVDWLQSVLLSPQVFPGMTTLQRTWGVSPGHEPKVEPIDLDIYVDSSGSMPSPQHNVSYLTLAGAVVALSALRVGSRVQATLWSGTREFLTTDGFVTDEQAILRILTGYFGGGTAFPLHILRDTYAQRPAKARKVHVLLISDDGADTMFCKDEKGNDGYTVVAEALARAGGGATAVLQLWNELDQYPFIKKATQAGWTSFRVRTWDELEAFAAAFSRQHYGRDALQARAQGRQQARRSAGTTPPRESLHRG